MLNDVDGALEAAAGLREPAPEHGAALAEVLDVVRLGARKSYNSSGPGMFGYVPGSGLYASAIADFLATATNRYMTLWMGAPIYAQIETTTVRWLADLVGYPESARGVLTTGGTTSLFSAVVTARVTKLGEDLANGVLYVSEQVNHAAVKSALLAGLPKRAIRVVPTGDSLTLDLDALDRLVAEDTAAGLRPFCVVANAGTTNTGAVDPLPEIARLCQRHDLWLHADAAYGGAFLLTEQVASVIGIHQAVVAPGDHFTIGTPHLPLPRLSCVRDGYAQRRTSRSKGRFVAVMGVRDNGQNSG